MQASINGIRMVYEVSGPDSAFPIVLHHPLATNMSIWDEITAVLTPRFRVVRFDARGHGQTEAPKGAYDFKTLGNDVVALMDHLNIKRAHYLGLSMGGMVGQYVGLDHPGRFASLQLVATSSRVPDEAKHLWVERITVARMIETTPLEGYAGWCQAIGTLNVTDRLKAIALPTQVIVGIEDPATPPAAAEAIHREIKGSTLIKMPGVAHMLCAEDPAAFHKHVLAFLDKVPAK